MSGVTLAGFGHYVPQRCVLNSEIETKLGLPAGWILRRTGIEARRYAGDDEALSDIAAQAGDMALRDAGLDKRDVGLLLLATSTPDHLLPPSAPLVAHRLGLPDAGAIDLAGACGGFIYALSLADSYARAQQRPVLVIAANILSRRINPSDRASSVLFGDAAGAVVIVPAQRGDAGIVAVKLASSGSNYGLIQIPGGGSRKPFAALADARETLMVIANGQAVYSEAVQMMTECAVSALRMSGVTAADVTYLIPHQANGRMINTVARQLAISKDRMLSTIAQFANSSAATIPLTLSMAHEGRRFTSGSILLMTAAGAGMTGGAVVFRT